MQLSDSTGVTAKAMRSTMQAAARGETNLAVRPSSETVSPFGPREKIPRSPLYPVRRAVSQTYAHPSLSAVFPVSDYRALFRRSGP